MEIGIEWSRDMQAFRIYNKEKPKETYCYKETVWEVEIAINALLRGAKP